MTQSIQADLRRVQFIRTVNEPKDGKNIRVDWKRVPGIQISAQTVQPGQFDLVATGVLFRVKQTITNNAAVAFTLRSGWDLVNSFLGQWQFTMSTASGPKAQRVGPNYVPGQFRPIVDWMHRGMRAVPPAIYSVDGVVLNQSPFATITDAEYSYVPERFWSHNATGGGLNITWAALQTREIVFDYFYQFGPGPGAVAGGAEDFYIPWDILAQMFFDIQSWDIRDDDGASREWVPAVAPVVTLSIDSQETDVFTAVKARPRRKETQFAREWLRAENLQGMGQTIDIDLDPQTLIDMSWYQRWYVNGPAGTGQGVVPIYTYLWEHANNAGATSMPRSAFQLFTGFYANQFSLDPQKWVPDADRMSWRAAFDMQPYDSPLRMLAGEGLILMVTHAARDERATKAPIISRIDVTAVQRGRPYDEYDYWLTQSRGSKLGDAAALEIPVTALKMGHTLGMDGGTTGGFVPAKKSSMSRPAALATPVLVNRRAAAAVLRKPVKSRGE